MPEQVSYKWVLGVVASGVLATWVPVLTGVYGYGALNAEVNNNTANRLDVVKMVTDVAVLRTELAAVKSHVEKIESQVTQLITARYYNVPLYKGQQRRPPSINTTSGARGHE